MKIRDEKETKNKGKKKTKTEKEHRDDTSYSERVRAK